MNCTAAASIITGIDTHAHVFERGLPLAAPRRYAPDYDAPLARYLAQLDAHGISHGVLVQPSFLGTDCSYLLAALAQRPRQLRGIAVLDPGADMAQLAALQRDGVVGLRLNLLEQPDPDLRSAAWRTTLAAVARLDWQVEVHAEARRLRQLLPPLLEWGIKVVVDHFGRPEPALGSVDPGFGDLLALGATRQVWVKISGAYRNHSDGGAPEVQAAAATSMALLRTAFGLDRLMWGSDWPHTQFESSQNYGQASALLDALLPDTGERRTVLVDTPADLFKFR